MNDFICTEPNCPEHTRSGVREVTEDRIIMVTYVGEYMVVTDFSLFHNPINAVFAVVSGEDYKAFMHLVVRVGEDGTYGDVGEKLDALTVHREFALLGTEIKSVEIRHDEIVRALFEGGMEFSFEEI